MKILDECANFLEGMYSIDRELYQNTQQDDNTRSQDTEPPHINILEAWHPSQTRKVATNTANTRLH
jgi:hypothetical protein